jgi:hypothetical protein
VRSALHASEAAVARMVASVNDCSGGRAPGRRGQRRPLSQQRRCWRRIGCIVAAFRGLARGPNENAPAITGRGVSQIGGAPSKTRTCDLQVRNFLRRLSTDVHSRPIVSASAELSPVRDSTRVRSRRLLSAGLAA